MLSAKVNFCRKKLSNYRIGIVNYNSKLRTKIQILLDELIKGPQKIINHKLRYKVERRHPSIAAHFMHVYIIELRRYIVCQRYMATKIVSEKFPKYCPMYLYNIYYGKYFRFLFIVYLNLYWSLCLQVYINNLKKIALKLFREQKDICISQFLHCVHKVGKRIFATHLKI